MITICTGWNPRGYHEYGKRFAESFAKYWPQSAKLVVYGEEKVELPRGEFRLLSEIPGCMEFLDRWRDDKAANGTQPNKAWKPKEHRIRYSWRFDAWKFSRQGFIPFDAALRCDTEYLAWLDGDVVTHSPVPENAFENLLRPDKSIAYLGRGMHPSEIGFQLYRLPKALIFLKEFRDLYATDHVFALRVTHSAFVWDNARSHFDGSMFQDLTPHGHGHVWFQSDLKKWTDHLKGKRKELGFSEERRHA